MCSHTAINSMYVSSYCYIHCYICVLILLSTVDGPVSASRSKILETKSMLLYMCPHTVTYSRWPGVCVKHAERSERQSQCRERDDSGDAKLLVYEALTY